MLRSMGQQCSEVRLPCHLEGIDALIMPGGESTTFSRLMDIYRLKDPIKEMASAGVSIWGTCAGMIMLAKELTDDKPTPLGLMGIQVTRNAFGRQLDSFEADLFVKPLGDQPFRAVFIRAPVISRIDPGVEARKHVKRGGRFHTTYTRNAR